ncbi:TMEM43 family protein [Desulfovibrio sp. OttesenSCG-928-M14]|nr:TMEM43 family protein [Desulfovibrio sp. OttesenSCG-928-M14]
MPFIENVFIGWFARIGASFSGMVLGLILFLLGTWLLWWNEGDFVDTANSLREAQGAAIELRDIGKLDPSLNGKVVHASGFADTQDILIDPVFKISTRAIALSRNVEFYQWTEQARSETKEKLGGGKETITTYTYTKRWVSRPVDSSGFKDENALSRNAQGVIMPLERFSAKAVNVSFGAYRLPPFFINSIGGSSPLTMEMPETAKAALNRQIAGVKAMAQHREATQSSRPLSAEGETLEEYVHQHGNSIYIGASPAVPQVGDVRVTFKETMPAQISIIAKVNGDTFERFYASNGKAVSKLSMGTLSMANMFGSQHSGNSFSTWVFRFLGGSLVVMGVGMLLAPLAVIASFIPLLGSIIGAGASVVSFLMGFAWSLFIISIAWLRFRPLTGATMLFIAGGLAFYLYRKGRRKKLAAQASSAS